LTLEGPRRLAVELAAHALLTAAFFADVLFLGRLPYFRDVGYQFHPGLVFTADALRHGVWPLWNPATDAGAPYLAAYPPELAMLAVLGARLTLVLSPPLHVWLAMAALAALARELGCSRASAWVAGAVFGLSGVFQSTLNLVPLSQAGAWAPLVAWAYLRCFRSPGPRAAAVLAIVSALQASTLAGEIVLQAAVLALALTPRLPSRQEWKTLGGAALLAAGLCAPVALGLRFLLAGTARAQGFSAAEALGWSIHPLALVEVVWPRFLGDPHTMTDLGYWGQPLFPGRYPYLIALYMGPIVLAFALCAGWAARRLWALVGVGVLLALGAYGPLGQLLAAVLPQFRSPVKYLFLATAALALLAGRGLDAGLAARRTRATWCLALPALTFVALGAAFHLGPAATRSASAAVWPRLASPEAGTLPATWGGALLQTGVLAALAAAGLWGGRRTAFAPAACLVADLVATNARVDPSAPAGFYDLAPEVAALVASAPDARAYRWFTYPLTGTAGVSWSPALLARNEDVWLYYADRQSLWARTKQLDGLEGALDEDRTGWSPAGSTFTANDSRPERHPWNHERLRQAGVRYVLAFARLPDERAVPLGQALVPGLRTPLVLHELRDPLPRAFWVSDCEAPGSRDALRARLGDPAFDAHRRVLLEAEPPGRRCGEGSGRSSAVRWRRHGPHQVDLEAEGDAGYVVFLEGFHPDWRVEGPTAVPLLRGNGRYWALPVPEGRVSLRIGFRPSWIAPSVAVAGLAGALVLALLARRPAVKLDTSSSGALASRD
jgi:hypothetical protein